MTRQKSLAARDRSSANRRGLSHADDASQYSGNQLKPSCTALDSSPDGVKSGCLQSAHAVQPCWSRGRLLLVSKVPDKHLNMFMHGREVCSEMSEPPPARPACANSAVHGPCAP